MKKIGIFVLGLMLLFVTGCGAEEKEQTLVCTTKENEDGMEVEEVISMTYQNDRLKHMTMSVRTMITDSTVQENWEAFKAAMDEDNQEFEEEGIRLDVETDDQNYEYKTTLDIDVDKASEESLEAQGFEGLKEDRSTLKDSKDSAEKDGAVCVIK